MSTTNLDTYGGNADRKFKATGFFRSASITAIRTT
jgi:hypothetical protein